jgi:lysophospholipase L1-like esterase
MHAISLRYVALGDSTGVGVGAREGGYVEHLFQRLRRERPGTGLLNLCASGATSSTVLSGQLQRAVRAKPHLVTLAVGGNDVWRQVPLAVYESNLEALARALVATGAQVVLGNVPDLSLAPVARLVPPALYEGRIDPLNAAAARVAARHGLHLVDLCAQSRVDLPARPELISGDGFHPSDAGYRRMAEHFWPTVQQALSRLPPAAEPPRATS